MVSSASIRTNGTQPAPLVGGEKRFLVAILVISIVAATMGWRGVRTSERWLLEKEALGSAVKWATFIQDNLSDLDGILSGSPPSEADRRLFEFAARAGNVFRYKVFGADGVIVFASRGGDVGKTNVKPYFIDLVRNGHTFVKIEDAEDFGEGHAVVSEAYVPIVRRGRFLGAIEVYVNMTGRALALRDAGNLGLIGLFALLAVMSAVFWLFSWHYVRARSRDLREAVESRRKLLKTSAVSRVRERQYRQLLESTNAIPWQADGATIQFTYVGPQAEKILGYAKEDWLRPGFWLEHLHPDDRDWVVDYCREATARNRNHDFEYRMLAANGGAVWLRDLVNVTTDELGTKTLRGLMIDVTERHHAEDIEAGRSKVLERLAAGASLTEVLTTLVETAEAANPRMLCSILLVDKDKQHLRLGAAPSLPAFYNEAIDGIEIGPGRGSCGTAGYTGERVIVGDISSHPHWVDFRDLAERAGLRACWSEPIVSAAGEVIGTLAIYHRVPHEPDRKEVEFIETTAHLAGIAISRVRTDAALRESEARFRAVVDHSPTKIHIKDLDGRYLLVNRRAEHLFGVDEKEALGKTSREIFVEDLATAFMGHDQAVVASGQAIEEEETWTEEDGVHTYLTVKFPIRDAAGAITAVGAIGTDITERKRVEEELRAAKEQAELSNRVKSEFLANISHELRTPLNAIIGFSDMIRDEKFGPVANQRYVEYARDINESGNHLLGLINDILDLSKIEAGTSELQETDVDVPAVIEACLSLVRERAAESGVKIACDAAPGLPLLHADACKLRQILLNLLSNAIKFTPPGGGATVTAWCGRSDGFVVQVADTGIGIAPEDIPKALAPFRQIDGNLDRRYAGTGLGLPLTKALMEIHGGSLDLQSVVGVGTKVTVRFPGWRAVPRAAAVAVAEPLVTHRPANSGF